LPRQRHEARHGGHEHHGPTAGLRNRGAANLRCQKGVIQDQIELRCPARVVEIRQWPEMGHADDIDQTRHGADRFARFAEQSRNLVSLRDIAGERMSADFMGDVLRKIRIAVHTTTFAPAWARAWET
jgi:hypothetical protein